MKIINKIIEIILNIIVVLVAICVILAADYIVQTKIMHKDYANIFGYTAFEVITGSMSGTIEVGDVVVAKITQDASENEIIVYKQGNSFITHRIIKIEGEEITTKGDANNSQDKVINYNQITGKVIKVIPKVAIWKRVLSTPVVFISIVTAIILLGFSVSTADKNEKDKKEKLDKKDKKDKYKKEQKNDKKQES